MHVYPPRDTGLTMGCALRRFVVGWLLLACAWAGLPAAAAGAYESSVSVSGTSVARPLPQGFLGIAIRFGTVTGWEPGGSAPPNPVLAQLVHNLNPTGRPSIRIGGESTDRSWWPTPGVSRPLGVTETLGPAWGQALKQLAVSTDAKLLLGPQPRGESTTAGPERGPPIPQAAGHGTTSARWRSATSPTCTP